MRRLILTLICQSALLNCFSQEIIITINGGNIYPKPEISYNEIITHIPAGSKIKVIDRVTVDFFHITWDKYEGYIYYTTIKNYDSYKISNKSIPNFQVRTEPEDEGMSDKTISAPPILLTSNITFKEENGNNRIDGNERCSISFTVANKGNGLARDLKAIVKRNDDIKGLNVTETVFIGNIESNSQKDVTIPLSSTIDLSSGTLDIKIGFDERLGFTPDPLEIKIETKEFVTPAVKVVDYTFLTDNGIINLGLPVQLKILLQNVGQGLAENAEASFDLPASNVYSIGPKNFKLGNLQPGDSKEILFEFIANKLYSEKTVPITARVSERFGRFSENTIVIASINSKSSGTTLNITSNVKDSNVDIQLATLSSEVDKNIPLNTKKHADRYALIIGNEDYSSYQSGLSSEVNVLFAINDALVMKQYCLKTLGIEERNIFLLTNATAGLMQQKIELTAQILTKLGDKAELIFYYAGHGFPDENSKEPYLIPVDVTATNLSSAIKLYDVCKKFSLTNAKKVSVFIDACFTGGGRQSGLLEARGVKIIPKEELLAGNIVIFAATTEGQSALPFKEKQHGMFTYFLLKKIQETKGEVTYRDLEAYIKTNVSIESLRINNKPQDPKTMVSPVIAAYWETWELR